MLVFRQFSSICYYIKWIPPYAGMTTQDAPFFSRTAIIHKMDSGFRRNDNFEDAALCKSGYIR